VLVEEVEPEEAVILAGAAVHRPVKVGRVANSGEDVPGRGDKQDQSDTGDWLEPLCQFRVGTIPE